MLRGCWGCWCRREQFPVSPAECGVCGESNELAAQGASLLRWFALVSADAISVANYSYHQQRFQWPSIHFFGNGSSNHCSVRKHRAMVILWDCDGFNGWVQSFYFLRIVSEEISWSDIPTLVRLQTVSGLRSWWPVVGLLQALKVPDFMPKSAWSIALDLSFRENLSLKYSCTFVLVFLITSRIEWKIWRKINTISNRPPTISFWQWIFQFCQFESLRTGFASWATFIEMNCWLWNARPGHRLKRSEFHQFRPSLPRNVAEQRLTLQWLRLMLSNLYKFVGCRIGVQFESNRMISAPGSSVSSSQSRSRRWSRVTTGKKNLKKDGILTWYDMIWYDMIHEGWAKTHEKFHISDIHRTRSKDNREGRFRGNPTCGKESRKIQRKTCLGTLSQDRRPHLSLWKYDLYGTANCALKGSRKSWERGSCPTLIL